MRLVTPNALSLALLIAFCLASAGLAQVVTFGITSAGPNNLAGVYTDPYNGVVCPANTTCTTSNQTPVKAFCDDFADDIYPPQFWQAFATDLSQIPDSPNTVYYTTGGTFNGNSYTESQEYVAAAILAGWSLQNSSNSMIQNELSFALWNLFDPAVFGTTPLTNPKLCPLGCMTATQASAAVNYELQALQAAVTYANGGAYESAAGVKVMIYTPEINGQVQPEPSSGTRPQEFITVVKAREPSTWADLGCDSIMIGLVGYVFWRRQSQKLI